MVCDTKHNIEGDLIPSWDKDALYRLKAGKERYQIVLAMNQDNLTNDIGTHAASSCAE